MAMSAGTLELLQLPYLQPEDEANTRRKGEGQQSPDTTYPRFPVNAINLFLKSKSVGRLVFHS